MLSYTHQGPFRNRKEIILASASPRRHNLLASLGIAFQVIPSKFREPEPEQDQTAQEYALETARKKATDIYGRQSKGIILAADSIVTLDGKILGKPKNWQDALKTLNMLCGKTHVVITACCFMGQEIPEPIQYTVSTAVNMNPAQQETLQAYIDCGEPLDKAGSYALQGAGGFLVQSIKGSYTNVIGLPLSEVVQTLLQLEAVRPVRQTAEFDNGD